MKEMISTALMYNNKQLKILDQKKLPHQEVWIDCNHPDEMVDIIKQLQVRGAPLIGVAAAISLADYALKGANKDAVLLAAKKLNESRPTAVNLMMAMDRMIFQNDDLSSENLCKIAENIFTEDVMLCQKIAENGAELINDGDNILTHCNTGGLATAGVGTAFGVILESYRQGKKIHVYVDETRPLLQGGRLTTWELEKAGIPYTLICDNMAGFLMSQDKIQKVIVGSDRIAMNGDFANKVGTYSVAVLAKYHGIPFYVAAPYTTIDFSCENGAGIPVEQRTENEVRGVVVGFEYSNKEDVIWSPKECDVYNPAFDVAPAELLTALVLDSGVISHDEIQGGRLKNLR